ncbi:hypothetical protein DMH88_09090 [Escherichia coli]|nr:hypothetical protein [Escherichia coli]
MYIAAPVICRSPYKMKKENLHFHFESKLTQHKSSKSVMHVEHHQNNLQKNNLIYFSLCK